MSYLKNKTKKKEWLKMKIVGYIATIAVILFIGYIIGLPDSKNKNHIDQSQSQPEPQPQPQPEPQLQFKSLEIDNSEGNLFYSGVNQFKATFTVNRKKCCGKKAGKNWDAKKTIFDKKFFKPDPECSIRINSKRAREKISFKLNLRQDTFSISKKIEKSLVLYEDSLIMIKCTDKDMVNHDTICNQTIKAEKFVFTDNQTIQIKTENGKLVLRAL